MPEKKTVSKAAPAKVAAKKRKPLDERTKDERVKAGIIQDIIEDYFRE